MTTAKPPARYGAMRARVRAPTAELHHQVGHDPARDMSRFVPVCRGSCCPYVAIPTSDCPERLQQLRCPLERLLLRVGLVAVGDGAAVAVASPQTVPHHS